MRRILIMIFILLISGVCWSLSPLLNLSSPTSTITYPTRTSTAIPPSPASTITPTITKTPASTWGITPTFTPTISPYPASESFTVFYHPDDRLYVGDLVSFEVISPQGIDVRDANLHVQIDPPSGSALDPVNFEPWGIQGRDQATLLWVWDTHDEDPGTHNLVFSIQPSEFSWTEQVTLLPSTDMPPVQVEASWAATQTECCTVFYITNTASERDLSALTSLMDEQARDSIEEMDSDFTQPITVTILPRLLGHGGFASSDISVSYLDRNYAANSFALVVHHEMIHTLDGQLGGDFRPNIFVEGLAVYMAGGHYKPEPLMPRAATLLDGYLDWYITLKTLANDFYSAQHEIGYLEAASLIEYMIRTYGWEEFSTFYRDIHIKPGESQSDAIDAALQAHFSISFSQLEQDFLSALIQEPVSPAWEDDVHWTVVYFDTLRRYQQLLDPSAYFRTAWLLDNKAMRERSIVADYLRHPNTPQNLALETLFITASHEMETKQFTTALQILDVINSILDGIENGTKDPFSVSTMAADYLSISTSLQQQGYEVQRIEIDENVATAAVTGSAHPNLIELHFARSDGEWLLTP